MSKNRPKIHLGTFVDDRQIFSQRWDMEKTPVTVQDIAVSESFGQIAQNSGLGRGKQRFKTHKTYKVSTFSQMSEGQPSEQPSLDPSSDPSIGNASKQGRIDDQTMRALIDMTKKRTDKKQGHIRKKSEPKLRQIISKQKVTNLKNKFIQKIKRNNSSSHPVQYAGFQQADHESIWQWQGFQTNCFIDNSIGLLSIFQIACLFVMFTLALVFSQLEDNIFTEFIQIFSLVFYSIEIIYNLITVKSKAGRKLIILSQIWLHYLKTNMVIDLLNLLILLVDSNTNNEVMHYARLFIITKLPQCLEKMEKLEVSFIKNYYNQQYWSLIKVVLFNFCFAHILAIFLTAMTKVNTTHNWYELKNIQGALWFEKYVWAYYWGVNIMLTVGFGDFYATNYKEALCLVFIEIISVMCLAYNINWVGTLISNIRAQDIEKGKNFKTFKQLSQKYTLPDDLEWRISNYIEESVNIRKKFNIQEEKSFIQSLPVTMRKEYLKESNKSIFHSLPFFSSLVDKTLYNFAQKIEMTISHPEQILRRIDDQYNLLILREGEIGFTAKRRNCDFNDMVMDKVKVKTTQRPFILGLEFLTGTKPIYEIKSLEYSVVYSLSFDDMLTILKESHMDYLHFCFLRDKNKSSLDEFEVFKCQICNNNQKHTKFTCPKLHFMPLNQIVIYKENHKERQAKNKRIKTDQWRIQLKKNNALTFNKKMRNLLGDIPGLMSDKLSQSNRRKNSKIGNSFLDKLQLMRKLRGSDIEETQTERIQEWFVKNATEMIKQEFDRHFRSQTYEDEVWIINCDKAKSYKEYFPESNPCSLQYSFCQDDRLDVLDKIKNEQERNIKIGSFACYLNSNSGSEELQSFTLV